MIKIILQGYSNSIIPLFFYFASEAFDLYFASTFIGGLIWEFKVLIGKILSFKITHHKYARNTLGDRSTSESPVYWKLQYSVPFVHSYFFHILSLLSSDTYYFVRYLKFSPYIILIFKYRKFLT